jgi:hypothetical protein
MLLSHRLLLLLSPAAAALSSAAATLLLIAAALTGCCCSHWLLLLLLAAAALTGCCCSHWLLLLSLAAAALTGCCCSRFFSFQYILHTIGLKYALQIRMQGWKTYQQWVRLSILSLVIVVLLLVVLIFHDHLSLLWCHREYFNGIRTCVKYLNCNLQVLIGYTVCVIDS